MKAEAKLRIVRLKARGDESDWPGPLQFAFDALDVFFPLPPGYVYSIGAWDQDGFLLAEPCEEDSKQGGFLIVQTPGLPVEDFTWTPEREQWLRVYEKLRQRLVELSLRGDSVLSALAQELRNAPTKVG